MLQKNLSPVHLPHLSSRVPCLKAVVTLAFTLCFLLAATISEAQVSKAKTKAEKTKVKDDQMKTKKSVDANAAMADANIMYPYSATYSSKFEMGSPAQAKMILDLWKDWDDNAFDRHADMFADTVTMMFPDGHVVKGKDNVMAMAKQVRSNYSSAKSTVEAWLPTRSLDKNENWVAIWGSEEDINNDGTKTTSYLHEIWRINKDGKVDFMRQYAAKPMTDQ